MQSEWSDDDVQRDVSEGRWVDDNLDVTPETTVGSLVPPHFDAYARVLHPVRIADADGRNQLVRWSDIARHTGAIVHAEMELHAIQSEPDEAKQPLTPTTPVVHWQGQLAAISRVLASYTRTPDDCWYAIWEGNSALDDIRDSRPTVAIAGYNHFLLRGSSDRASDLYRGLEPNLWWPADHAWCVAAHFDFPSLYLGGNAEAVAHVLGIPSVEAWPARVDQGVTADNDGLNG